MGEKKEINSFTKEELKDLLIGSGTRDSLIEGIIKKAIEQFEIKKTSEFDIKEKNTFTIYNKLSKNIKEKYNIECIIYKDVEIDDVTKHTTACGLMLRYKENIYDIYTFFNKELMDYEEDNEKTLFSINEITVKKLNIEIPCYGDQILIKEMLGNELYKEFTDYFLNEQNLIVRNSIYKVY